MIMKLVLVIVRLLRAKMLVADADAHTHAHAHTQQQGLTAGGGLDILLLIAWSRFHIRRLSFA